MAQKIQTLFIDDLDDSEACLLIRFPARWVRPLLQEGIA